MAKRSYSATFHSFRSWRNILQHPVPSPTIYTSYRPTPARSPRAGFLFSRLSRPGHAALCALPSLDFLFQRSVLWIP